MRSLMFSIVFLLALASLANAQGTVTWNQLNAATPTQAQGFTYKLYVTPSGSTTQSPAVVLSSVLCGGSSTTATCSAPLPSTASAALTTGAKSALTATDGTGVESAPSVPFSKPTDVPTNLRITP